MVAMRRSVAISVLKRQVLDLPTFPVLPVLNRVEARTQASGSVLRYGKLPKVGSARNAAWHSLPQC